MKVRFNISTVTEQEPLCNGQYFQVSTSVMHWHFYGNHLLFHNQKATLLCYVYVICAKCAPSFGNRYGFLLYEHEHWVSFYNHYFIWLLGARYLSHWILSIRYIMFSERKLFMMSDEIPVMWVMLTGESLIKFIQKGDRDMIIPFLTIPWF